MQVKFSSQFYVHINGKFLHAFMQLCLVRLWLLCGGEKTDESNNFYNSAGTSIWVRIMPVKLHWSLTSIIRTYTIIYILYCSTKPLVFFSTSFERRSAGKFFSSILRSHKCEIIYTRFHAFMLSSTLALMWRKNR